MVYGTLALVVGSACVSSRPPDTSDAALVPPRPSACVVAEQSSTLPTGVPTPEPEPTPRPVATPTLRTPKVSVPLSLAQLNSLLDSLLPEPNDPYAVVVEDLASGARVARNDTRVYPSASLYKLGVAWAVLRHVDAGEVGLDTPIEIIDDDAVEVEPYGGVAPGETPTVREALAAMLTVSSNAAAHAFMRVLGRGSVNAEFERIGLGHTRIPEPNEDAGQGDGTVVTTAADVARLLRVVATSADLSAESRGMLVAWLANSVGPDALRDRPVSGVDVLDKTGNLDDASNVAAVVQSSRGTLLLVVLDQGVDPGDARGVISRIGEVIFAALTP